MMDYYSNFPPPSKVDAIKEVVQACKIKVDIDETVLLDTVTDVINEMPSLGSYTGWYVSFKGDAINMVLKKVGNKNE